MDITLEHLFSFQVLNTNDTFDQITSPYTTGISMKTISFIKIIFISCVCIYLHGCSAKVQIDEIQPAPQEIKETTDNAEPSAPPKDNSAKTTDMPAVPDLVMPTPAPVVPKNTQDALDLPTPVQPSNGNSTPQLGVANEVAIPELIPEPLMTTPPEQRLTFKKTLKTKKGAPEYLIFTDKELNTSCYIAVHNYNPKALDDNRYCIPFSGREKDLTHPMAVTKTAAAYENYPYCAAIINPDKGNIPGLAGFFKAFNPNYYASDLARFIDNPFQIHKPEAQYKSGFGEDGTAAGWDKYYRQGPGCIVQKDEWDNIQLVNPACLLKNPFITESEYNQYGLRPGVVFLTASAKKGEKVLHQYWQVFDGIPETIIIETLTDGYSIMEFDENIVQVKDLSSKETYQVLMPQILAAMPLRNRYCEAVNNALINEARSGKWARVDNNSPLMKKR